MKKRSIKPTKAPAKKTSWDMKKWADRCAWCTKRIAGDDPAFGISISLRPEAFQEFDPGTVQPLLLFNVGKTIPMMVVKEDSPAKHAGKDAMFQACSEVCAKALQQALRDELGGSTADQ